MSDLLDVAEANFRRHLAGNSYPGRGLVLGRSADGGAWPQLYWIMGRSANSRTRVFVADGGTLRTEPFDAASVARESSPALASARLKGKAAHMANKATNKRH